MKKWRKRQKSVRSKRSYPGEIDERVGFLLGIHLEKCSRIVGRLKDRAGDAIDFIDLSLRHGDLVVVSPRGGDKPQLVFRINVENQRAKSTETIFGVMKHLQRRR